MDELELSVKSILGNRLLTSIECNGLYIPSSGITEYCGRYSNPALYYDENFGTFGLSRGGSATYVTYRSRYFVITSKHQQRKLNADYKTFCVHNTERSTFITSHSVHFPLNDPEENHDFLVYEFTDAVNDGALSQHIWFDINRQDFAQPTIKPNFVITVGFPAHRASIIYEEDRYTRAPNAVIGKECPPTISNRLCFAPIEQIKFDPKGMSGAPVFGIVLEDLKYSLFFAGIVTEANTKKFHFYKARHILRMVEKASHS